jgi:sigma-B regulation protein RsbU (phosphoserine phosphatase)
VTPLIAPPRRLTPREAISRIGWWERLFFAFLLLLILTGVFGMSTGWTALAVVGLIITAPVALWRIGKLLLRTLIWRLRNRLIVAYVFIAVVPLVLLATLGTTIAYFVTGQMAVYLVTSELERQVGTMRGAAESILRVPADRRQPSMDRLGNFFEEKYPNFELRIDQAAATYRYPEGATINKPPQGWKDQAGILRMGGNLYLWAHVQADDGEVTALAPLTDAFLSNLIPNLGVVNLLESIEQDTKKGIKLRKRPAKVLTDVKIPDPINRLDWVLGAFGSIPLSDWEQPGGASNAFISVQSRVFTVLKIIFSRKSDWDQNYLLGPLVAIAALFLIFEIIALIIGVTLTHTITNTVHDIYEGTNRVMEGNFSHRIVLQGRDQLAQLGESFNRMTENLERLLQVAKENERLNAELEIAREVQRQLYPKTVPESKYLCITAHYQPARMVSGDYFDFHRVSERELCFTMGDVAGKGISAALLMATVQSSFRSNILNSGDVAMQPAKLVTELNKILYANTAPEKFATFFFGIYDEPTGMLRYTNAGHLPPILLRNGEAQLLNVDGMVVGAFPFAQYGESSIELLPGDLLLLYTDGISEPQNEFDEMYGEERLIELVKKNAHLDDTAMIQAIMNAVQQWTGSPELQDDMTLLIARRP